MTIRATRASNLTMTASEWERIMTALDAYQHHSAFRDLRDKLAMTAGASSTAAAAGGGRSQSQARFMA